MLLELRAQLVRKEELLVQGKQDLESMNKYQVFI